MVIANILVYIYLIVCFTICIHFERRNSYRKGFLDGVEQYSKLVEEVLQTEEPGINLKPYIGSINHLMRQKVRN